MLVRFCSFFSDGQVRYSVTAYYVDGMFMTYCSLAKPGQVTGATSADNLAEQDADYCEHASDVTHYLASMQGWGMPVWV